MATKPKITFLPVDNGDSIVIMIDDFTIVIDGGLANKYKTLKNYLISNEIENIDLSSCVNLEKFFGEETDLKGEIDFSANKKLTDILCTVPRAAIFSISEPGISMLTMVLPFKVLKPLSLTL